jgi:hypothetical protein
MKTIIREDFSRDVLDVKNSLLEMARKECWNKIVDNCTFILSETKCERNALESRIESKKDNEKKNLKSFDEMIRELNSIYSNLYDVNLYIYKARKNNTIIEVQYFLKSSLMEQHIETLKNDPPMLHCKVSIPQYAWITFEEKRKFDINWELGGIRHEWNMFRWRRKVKKKD